jgi:hypothetical protein
MKSFLVVTALLFAAGCTTVHRIDSTQFEVIPVPQGLQDASKCEEMQKRISHGKTVILKVAQGEQIPFRLTMDLPMGLLEKCESAFAFKHDTYFLLSEKKFYLSPDGQRWASVASPRSLGKVFGFRRGNVSFGFVSRTNESTFMKVEIEAK